jgi:N-acetylmuramoyl-L-alanine amidase
MKVCIDAGHGGVDPGAMFNDLKEKNVTLSIARELQAMLRPLPVDVVMTRSGDDTLGLRKRVDIANNANCDLFMSIHTNADPDEDEPGMPEAEGQEIFYISEAGRKLGARLGAGLQTEFPDEPWRGLKKRGLYVVRKTTMPAVLVEVAFIDDSDTNRELRDVAVRKQIAFALLRGLIGVEEIQDA